MDNKEIELKLALSSKGLERLKTHPAVKANQSGKPKTQRLCSVYYDTPDQLLAQAGITARLRTLAADHIQTVKTAGTRASGLFSRQEWENAVAGNALDHAALRATGLPLLQDEGVLAALSPIFTTDVKRRLFRLGGDGWDVELALDQGEILAGEARETICEAELELREGPPSRLFALARELTDAIPARLLVSSKSERGYDLSAGRMAAPVKSDPVMLTAEMGVSEAFRAIARNCLHHLLANEPSLIDRNDAEAVHQMRVALRRLRSALKLFSPLVRGPQLAQIKAEIKWLLTLLGPARDTEVFLAEIIAPVASRNPGNSGFAALQDHWRDRRDRDFASAQAAVRDRRFTGLLLDLGAWVEAGDWCNDPDLSQALATEPLAPFAGKLLDKQERRMRKAGGKSLAKLTPAHLHEVRIEGKQLRYAGEFFAPLYGKKDTKAFLSILADLQNLLGEINDIAVAAPRLSGCHHLDGQAWAAGVVAGWHEARRPKLLAEAGKAWSDLRKQKRFWKG